MAPTGLDAAQSRQLRARQPEGVGQQAAHEEAGE